MINSRTKGPHRRPYEAAVRTPGPTPRSGHTGAGPGEEVVDDVGAEDLDPLLVRVLLAPGAAGAGRGGGGATPPCRWEWVFSSPAPGLSAQFDPSAICQFVPLNDPYSTSRSPLGPLFPSDSGAPPPLRLAALPRLARWSGSRLFLPGPRVAPRSRVSARSSDRPRGPWAMRFWGGDQTRPNPSAGRRGVRPAPPPPPPPPPGGPSPFFY